MNFPACEPPKREHVHPFLRRLVYTQGEEGLYSLSVCSQRRRIPGARLQWVAAAIPEYLVMLLTGVPQ